jgi:hypothetical protein
MTTPEERELNERTIEIKTECKECVFASWDGNTQSGCNLDRIDRFEDQGLTTLKEEDGKQFFLIDTFCNTCRNDEWADRQKDDVYDVIKREMELKVDLFVLSLFQGDEAEAKIKQTLLSVLEMELKPKKLVIVIMKKKKDYAKILTAIESIMVDEDGKQIIPFRLVGVFRTTANTLGELVDEGFSKAENVFYCTFSAGYEIPSNYLKKVDHLVNVEMEKFSMIEPLDQFDGFMVQNALHKILYGNNKMPLSEKVKILAEEQEVKHMVRKWDQL